MRSVFEYLQTVRGKATAAKSKEYEDMKGQHKIGGMGEGREGKRRLTGVDESSFDDLFSSLPDEL